VDRLVGVDGVSEAAGDAEAVDGAIDGEEGGEAVHELVQR